MHVSVCYKSCSSPTYLLGLPPCGCGPLSSCTCPCVTSPVQVLHTYLGYLRVDAAHCPHARVRVLQVLFKSYIPTWATSVWMRPTVLMHVSVCYKSCSSPTYLLGLPPCGC